MWNNSPDLGTGGSYGAKPLGRKGVGGEEGAERIWMALHGSVPQTGIGRARAFRCRVVPAIPRGTTLRASPRGLVAIPSSPCACPLRPRARPETFRLRRRDSAEPPEPLPLAPSPVKGGGRGRGPDSRFPGTQGCGVLDMLVRLCSAKEERSDPGKPNPLPPSLGRKGVRAARARKGRREKTLEFTNTGLCGVLGGALQLAVLVGPPKVSVTDVVPRRLP